MEYNISKKEWRKNNLHKIKAHNALHTALENGSIIKQPCTECGIIEVEAHHEDYSKSLEVTWLCKKHHHKKHRISKRLRGQQ